MNIDDNRLNELMEKTQELIKRKSLRRKRMLAGALGTAAIAAAVLAFTFMNPNGIPDVVIGSSPSGGAAAENTYSVTPTPLPDGSTWNPDAGPTPVAFSQDMWDLWSESTVVDGVTVKATLALEELSLPPAGSSPVAEVEPADFDLAFAEKAVEYFFGSQYYEYLFTKSDYEKIYAAEKAAYENLENVSEETQTYIDGRLKEISDWMKQAPETDSPGKIEFNEEGSLWVKGYSPEGDFSNIIIHKGDERYGSSFFYRRGDVALDYHPSEMFIEDTAEESKNEIPIPDDVTGTRMLGIDEAAEVSWQIVKFFDEDMRYAFGVYGHAYNPRGNSESLADVMADGTAEKCFIFYYTKQYPGGLRSTLGEGAGNGINSKIPSENDEMWGDEIITVVWDAKGLYSFTWVNKTDTVKITDNDADLISVEETMQIFKDNVFKTKWQLAAGGKTELYATKLNFEMAKIKAEDSGYLMVPAYVIKGTQKSVTVEGYSFTNYFEIDDAALLTINAIDGSIID